MLENISDWLGTALDFYGKKRQIDRATNLQEKQIAADVESRKLDLQLAQATQARRTAAQANMGFTDIKPMQIDIPYSDKPSANSIPSWIWPVLIGVVVLIIGVPLLRGGK